DRRLPAIVHAPARMPALEGAVPLAAGHVDRPHLHAGAGAAAAARVLDDLAGRIEPHRLRIEQGAGERRRLVALEPAADVDQLGERGGVALREPVGAEALDLVEDLVDELRGVTLALHQLADAHAMRLHVAAAPPS